MFEGDTSTRQIVGGAGQVLAIIIVGLVAAVVVTAFAERLATAQLLASVAGGLSTVLLAGLVGWYATAAERNATRARKHQRRPYVKRIVATGIDRVLDWLAESRERWTVADPPAGMPVYPQLDALGVPEAVVADLSREHPDLVAEVSEYLTVVETYRDDWERLHTDLTRHIQQEFEFVDGSASIDDFVPAEYAEDARSDDVDSSTRPAVFVRDNAALFARLILENPDAPADDRTELDVTDYAHFLLDAKRSELMQLRGADAIADQVDLVHRRLDEVTEGGDAIETRLEAAREDYVEEYDILETELGEIKHGGRLAV